ncbi:hypothetical protein DKX38_001718 [Salix brachista]|uniref:CCHC-type domain-containing protein n=1 Tax=Salix brachista TaxID=2182728 RepID=A0A5N5P4J7_9ROSI|nr:hypothetical protein DKX38_001718 [Salix brachista]
MNTASDPSKWDTYADLWAAIDEQRQAMTKMEAMIQQLGTPKVVPDQTSRGASSSNSPAGNCTTAVAKEAPRAPNTYAKTGGFKCYRCGQPGHRSNECPARRPVNFIGAGADGEEGQYEGEETEMEELLEGAEIAEEEGDFVNCVGERMSMSSIGKAEKSLWCLSEIQEGSRIKLRRRITRYSR